MSTAAFNRWCLLLGAAVLTALVMGRFVLRHNYQDFAQFYMGGVIAAEREWDALYPVPHPGSARNPGERAQSSMRPRYAELAAERGVGDSFRFIQPPPNALVYRPLAWLDFRRAHLVWTLLSLAFGVVVAWQAGRVLALCLGRDSRWCGALVLVVAASPSMYQSVRMGQVSTFVGACIGAVVLGLLRDRAAGGALGMVLGAMTKYAPAVLLPVALAARAWRMLAWSAGATVLILVASVAVMGTRPFRVWFLDIAPTLGRSDEWNGNQSIYGFLTRVTTGVPPLDEDVAAVTRAVSVLVLLGLLALVFGQRRDAWREPRVACAACAGLLAWLHVFSPIFWNHYEPYLFPIWGWLAWEALSSRRVAWVAGVAAALAWAPAAVIPRLGDQLPEPARSHMLWGAVLVLLLAAWRLGRSTRIDA